jgi:nicotinate phosphoribosyltransferase
MAAIAEGTVVFPQEPLLRVQGPLLQCQLLETALLNIVNFQTLIATKAARVCQATQGQPVLEFGLRRAQGIDGALTASRAAYIGGCAGTSNVLAGKLYGIPVKGTHAHSWVMSFPSEAEAFQAYAQAMPHNCIFLVDTFDTLNGVKQAIVSAQWLQDHGYPFLGIRLDSGDLVALSQQSRTLLDAAGFPQARIVASNDLDEYLITDLKAAGAAIDVWGVGTKLVTSYDQPALGGVYKLTATRDVGGEWQYRLKLSEDPLKISNPGLLQVRRFVTDHGGQKRFVGDMLYDELHPPVETSAPHQDLLIPMLRHGQPVGEQPSLTQIRAQVQEQLACCPEEMKRFQQPAIYPVHLEEGLYRLKEKLIFEATN